jgi:hypothetical protein
MQEGSLDWRCRIGRHKYVDVADENPEKRGQTHLQCTRCGNVKEVNEYLPGNPGLGGG